VGDELRTTLDVRVDVEVVCSLFEFSHCSDFWVVGCINVF